jgi:hypothetical protein
LHEYSFANALIDSRPNINGKRYFMSAPSLVI